MLVFIAPDENDVGAFDKALREYLAWKSIDDEKEQLNLDAQQRKQVDANLKRTDETVISACRRPIAGCLSPSSRMRQVRSRMASVSYFRAGQFLRPCCPQAASRRAIDHPMVAG